MKVHELIHHLLDMPENANVVLAVGADGAVHTGGVDDVSYDDADEVVEVVSS